MYCTKHCPHVLASHLLSPSLQCLGRAFSTIHCGLGLVRWVARPWRPCFVVLGIRPSHWYDRIIAAVEYRVSSIVFTAMRVREKSGGQMKVAEERRWRLLGLRGVRISDNIEVCRHRPFATAIQCQRITVRAGCWVLRVGAFPRRYQSMFFRFSFCFLFWCACVGISCTHRPT